MPSRETILTIEKTVGRGLGLAHGEGATWMISGALPGETVQVQTTGQRAGVSEGVCLGVLDGAHPTRLSHPCPHSPECGGCDWPHVDPEAGASLKIMAAA